MDLPEPGGPITSCAKGMGEYISCSVVYEGLGGVDSYDSGLGAGTMCMDFSAEKLP